MRRINVEKVIKYKDYTGIITNTETDNLDYYCAYVVIPKDDKIYGIDAKKLNSKITSYGGITFSNYAPNFSTYYKLKDLITKDDYIIGIDFIARDKEDTKVWTLSEVEKELKNLINEIKNF